MRDKAVKDVRRILPHCFGYDDRCLWIDLRENLHAFFLRTDEAVLELSFVGMGANEFVAELGHGGSELLLHRLLEGPSVFVGGLAEITVGDELNGFNGSLFHEGLDNISRRRLLNLS